MESWDVQEFVANEDTITAKFLNQFQQYAKDIGTKKQNNVSLMTEADRRTLLNTLTNGSISSNAGSTSAGITITANSLNFNNDIYLDGTHKVYDGGQTSVSAGNVWTFTKSSFNATTDKFQVFDGYILPGTYMFSAVAVFPNDTLPDTLTISSLEMNITSYTSSSIEVDTAEVKGCCPIINNFETACNVCGIFTSAVPFKVMVNFPTGGTVTTSIPCSTFMAKLVRLVA